MTTTYKILLAFMVSLLVLLSYLEAKEPEAVNWTASYTTADKIPLGAYALFESLKDQDFPVQKVNRPPFEFLNDTSQTGTYFFLNDHLSFNDSELKKLFRWIEKGNSAFIIAESFQGKLLDSLNLKGTMLTPEKGISAKAFFRLSDDRLEKDRKYYFDRQFYQFIIKDYDTLEQEVLGYTQLHKDSVAVSAPGINFLRDSIGKGALYLHTSPKTFSNYFLLQPGNSEYIEKVLAYLPADQTLFWDDYYKSGKAFYSSPLFVLLNRKALKWAYYFAILGSILFIIFEGKRKQRSIPVIEPLRNQTVHFARTVSGLYLNRKDYKAIAAKKITLFLEFVRSHHRISTAKVNEEFYSQLAGLSGNTPEKVKALWDLMAKLDQKKEIEKGELLKLSRKIDEFKKPRHGK